MHVFTSVLMQCMAELKQTFISVNKFQVMG